MKLLTFFFFSFCQLTDKVCDQISDAILDECIRQDRHSRCGIEVVVGKGQVFVTSEITTAAKLNVSDIT